MLQGRNLVAQSVMGDRRQVVPTGIMLRICLQGIERLPETVESDILLRRLLILGAGGLSIALPVTAKGIVAAVGVITAPGGLGLFRILDLLLCRIYLLHFLRSHRITGVYIRVIFFCQPPVCPFDLLVGSIPADAQDLIRIINHPVFSSLVFGTRPKCRYTKYCLRCAYPAPAATVHNNLYTAP